MPPKHGGLTPANLIDVQQLVLDIHGVNRNHLIPGTDVRETVAVHSYALAMLCWCIHEGLGLGLDRVKIFKYALAHDLLERGLTEDTNAFASQEAKDQKIEQERLELEKLSQEFPDFPDLIATIRNYEDRLDEESLFVWTVDKMQAIILGMIDDWRPYRSYKGGIPYDAFVAKYDYVATHCSPYLSSVFADVFTMGRETYWDQPA